MRKKWRMVIETASCETRDFFSFYIRGSLLGVVFNVNAQ